MEENRIKAVVVRSGCPLYAVGDAVYFDGPLLDKDKSGNLCMMALNAIFPFVYAARKGVLKETPVQCPDCEEHVEFMLQEEPRDCRGARRFFRSRCAGRSLPCPWERPCPEIFRRLGRGVVCIFKQFLKESFCRVAVFVKLFFSQCRV